MDPTPNVYKHLTCKCKAYAQPFPYNLLEEVKNENEFIDTVTPNIKGDNFNNVTRHHAKKYQSYQNSSWVSNTVQEDEDSNKKSFDKVWNSKLTINSLVNNLRGKGNNKYVSPITSQQNNSSVCDNYEEELRKDIRKSFLEANLEEDVVSLKSVIGCKDVKVMSKGYSSLHYTINDKSIHSEGSISNRIKSDNVAVNNKCLVIKQYTDKAILAEKGLLLHKTIGKGNFSKVVVGSNPTGRDIYAIKIVNLTTAPADFKSKFLPRELKIWPTLHHKNIIRMYSSFRRANKIYVMLEFACNGDVLEYIQKYGRRTERQSHRWFIQTASAIKYMHEHKSIAHRDLKLENLMLDCRLNIKIADFGFCRQISDTSFKSYQRAETYHDLSESMSCLSQTYCGSKSYASPEILKSIPYDPKCADIWSLGVIVCVWVSSHMPFDEKVRSTDHLIESQKRWSIRQLRQWTYVSTEFEDLITKLLKFNPQHRISIGQALSHEWTRKMNCDSYESYRYYRPVTAPPPLPLIDNQQYSNRLNNRPKTTYPSNCNYGKVRDEFNMVPEAYIKSSDNMNRFNTSSASRARHLLEPSFYFRKTQDELNFTNT